MKQRGNKTGKIRTKEEIKDLLLKKYGYKIITSDFKCSDYVLIADVLYNNELIKVRLNNIIGRSPFKKTLIREQLVKEFKEDPQGFKFRNQIGNLKTNAIVPEEWYRKENYLSPDQIKMLE